MFRLRWVIIWSSKRACASSKKEMRVDISGKLNQTKKGLFSRSVGPCMIALNYLTVYCILRTRVFMNVIDNIRYTYTAHFIQRIRKLKDMWFYVFKFTLRFILKMYVGTHNINSIWNMWCSHKFFYRFVLVVLFIQEIVDLNQENLFLSHIPFVVTIH